VPLPSEFADALRAIVGAEHVRLDAASLERYGADGLKRGHDADLVVLPDGADQVSAVLRRCSADRVPVVPAP
jgi:FAD/FMN-containing dehydrogenase